MIKSILVAIDDSISSRSALTAAVELAGLTRAELKGLYVEDILRLLEWQPTELIGATIGATSNLPTSRSTREQIEIEKEFLEEGGKLKKLFTDSGKSTGINYSFEIERGKVDEKIIQFSRSVDLVVIGRRGKSYPLDSSEIGPTAETILRYTTRPVLVVPPESKLTSKILIAYDSSETSQRALCAGAQLASSIPSEVLVITVSDDIDSTNNSLNEAKEFLSPYKLKASFVTGFDKNKPWKAILENAGNFNAGLIVLGAYGSNRLLELIFGSTTREVLAKAKCPVLLCR